MCLRVDQSKRCKDRYVPLSARLLNQLRDYWRRASPPAQWLFSGHPTDRAMTRSGTSWIYRTAAKNACINKPGAIHTLRHNYVTGLLEAGVELCVIQRRMGHRSISSTMRYLHIAQDKGESTSSRLDLLEFPEIDPPRSRSMGCASHERSYCRPALELADIARASERDYRAGHRLPSHHDRVLRALVNCRTAALGGFKYQCDTCERVRTRANACERVRTRDYSIRLVL